MGVIGDITDREITKFAEQHIVRNLPDNVRRKFKDEEVQKYLWESLQPQRDMAMYRTLIGDPVNDEWVDQFAKSQAKAALKRQYDHAGPNSKPKFTGKDWQEVTEFIKSDLFSARDSANLLNDRARSKVAYGAAHVQGIALNPEQFEKLKKTVPFNLTVPQTTSHMIRKLGPVDEKNVQALLPLLDPRHEGLKDEILKKIDPEVAKQFEEELQKQRLSKPGSPVMGLDDVILRGLGALRATEGLLTGIPHYLINEEDEEAANLSIYERQDRALANTGRAIWEELKAGVTGSGRTPYSASVIVERHKDKELSKARKKAEEEAILAGKDPTSTKVVDRAEAIYQQETPGAVQWMHQHPGLIELGVALAAPAGVSSKLTKGTKLAKEASKLLGKGKKAIADRAPGWVYSKEAIEAQAKGSDELASIMRGAKDTGSSRGSAVNYLDKKVTRFEKIHENLGPSEKALIFNALSGDEVAYKAIQASSNKKLRNAFELGQNLPKYGLNAIERSGLTKVFSEAGDVLEMQTRKNFVPTRVNKTPPKPSEDFAKNATRDADLDPLEFSSALKRQGERESIPLPDAAKQWRAYVEEIKSKVPRSREAQALSKVAYENGVAYRVKAREPENFKNVIAKAEKEFPGMEFTVLSPAGMGNVGTGDAAANAARTLLRTGSRGGKVLADEGFVLPKVMADRLTALHRKGMFTDEQFAEFVAGSTNIANMAVQNVLKPTNRLFRTSLLLTNLARPIIEGIGGAWLNLTGGGLQSLVNPVTQMKALDLAVYSRLRNSGLQELPGVGRVVNKLADNLGQAVIKSKNGKFQLTVDEAFKMMDDARLLNQLSGKYQMGMKAGTTGPIGRAIARTEDIVVHKGIEQGIGYPVAQATHFVEDWAHSTAFIDSLRRKPDLSMTSVLTAGDYAARVAGNVHRMGYTERGLGNFINFWGWARFIIPRTIEVAAKQPEYFQKAIRAREIWNQEHPHPFLNLDDVDWLMGALNVDEFSQLEEYQKALRDGSYQTSSPEIMFLRPETPLSLFLPHFQKGGALGGLVDHSMDLIDWARIFSPMIQLPIELLTGHHIKTGQQYEPEDRDILFGELAKDWFHFKPPPVDKAEAALELHNLHMRDGNISGTIPLWMQLQVDRLFAGQQDVLGPLFGLDLPPRPDIPDPLWTRPTSISPTRYGAQQFGEWSRKARDVQEKYLKK